MNELFSEIGPSKYPSTYAKLKEAAPEYFSLLPSLYSMLSTELILSPYFAGNPPVIMSTFFIRSTLKTPTLAFSASFI